MRMKLSCGRQFAKFKELIFPNGVHFYEIVVPTSVWKHFANLPQVSSAFHFLRRHPPDDYQIVKPLFSFLMNAVTLTLFVLRGEGCNPPPSGFYTT